MPLYAYKATASNGTKYTGYRFAITINEIYKSLKEEGLLLTDCKETKAERFLPRVASRYSTGVLSRIPRILLIDFCHHMAQLDEAGVRIDSALEDLALSTPHRGFRSLLHLVHKDVQDGIPLSEALARHPKVFDRVFQKLIATAEQVGAYAPQFRHLENHLRRLEVMSHQIQKTIRSPLILVGLMVILLLIVIDFVIPNMASLLASLGLKDLPLSTRLLLHIAPTLTYIPLFLMGVCGLWFVLCASESTVLFGAFCFIFSLIWGFRTHAFLACLWCYDRGRCGVIAFFVASCTSHTQSLFAGETHFSVRRNYCRGRFVRYLLQPKRICFSYNGTLIKTQ